MSKSEFPQWSIGTVSNSENTYEVHWLAEDTARLDIDGEEIIEFSSLHIGGFVSIDDVIDEAVEVAWDLEDEWYD